MKARIDNMQVTITLALIASWAYHSYKAKNKIENDKFYCNHNQCVNSSLYMIQNR